MGTTYVTSKEDYAANYVPTPSDLNRIESNIDYLREQDATLNGAKTFTESLNLSIGDVLDSRKISFEVSGTERAYIDFVRHTATGQLTWIDFVTMGTLGMRLTDTQTLELNGNLNPTTTPTNGTWTTTQTIPRGQYMVSPVIYSGSILVAQGASVILNITATTDGGGVIFSDGINTTVQISGGGNNLKWWKF